MQNKSTYVFYILKRRRELNGGKTISQVQQAAFIIMAASLAFDYCLCSAQSTIDQAFMYIYMDTHTHTHMCIYYLHKPAHAWMHLHLSNVHMPIEHIRLCTLSHIKETHTHTQTHNHSIYAHCKALCAAKAGLINTVLHCDFVWAASPWRCFLTCL